MGVLAECDEGAEEMVSTSLPMLVADLAPINLMSAYHADDAWISATFNCQMSLALPDKYLDGARPNRRDGRQELKS